MPGEGTDELTVYLIDDPHNDIDEKAFLSFWAGDPPHPDLERTTPYVLSTLGVSTESDDGHNDGVTLQRGEELLVRAIPNRRGGDDAFYLNVTSFVIRDPGKLISKSKLRTQERCPREYYLRYVKRVYPGDKFDVENYEQGARFRGNAVHKITENAFKQHLDRFRDASWTHETVESFCEDQFAAEFGFEQALLVLSGAGLDVRDHVKDAVTTLFTDDEFLTRIDSADHVSVEQYLSNDYGYAGRVDILLDGTPYDIKTTRKPDTDDVRTHSKQIKLYLFALLLERIDRGQSFRQSVNRGQDGYLVYPNVKSDGVRFEQVELTMDDVREFLHARNEVIETGDAFAPPSTYNRECEDCSFAVEEWISGPDDTLPPACTYHCQNERRWPCYEFDGNELTTDCSLFDRCDQRLKYRDPEVIDHYESVRVAFQKERRARATARSAVDTFDDTVLTEAGYRIPEMVCVGARAAGTVIQFESTQSVVPAFEPGEIVRIEPEDGTSSDRAIYFGRSEGQFLFSPVEPGVDVADFLTPDTSYRATYSFSVETIDDRYLPYLDFAQRRNAGDKLNSTSDAGESDEIPPTVSTSAVPEYLDREKLFVDLPVSTRRTEDLGALVRELVTAPYPDPRGDGTVPAEARRALVLCATPEQAEQAVAAQPDGDHYRLDGTGGPDAIKNSDGYHEIQNRLLDSRSLVSTIQQATGLSGPGGGREFFHRLEEGAFGNRDHSENFFDVLVLLGAERLTEPEFHFLADIADRLVAIGDSRQSGPRLLSTAAANASLDVYFEQQFERYRAFPTEEAASLQLQGEAPPALRKFYRDGPWDAIDGEIQFLGIEGDEETALDTVELEASVPAATGSGQRLVFDVTDTPLSPMAARELFEDRTELDATKLRKGTVVVIDDESLFLTGKEPLDGEDPTHHQVTIQAEPSELPQFSRALLSNRIAERIVTEVAEAEDPDAVVTPFEKHGTKIARLLDEKEVDVPVRRPEELDGSIADHTIISFATSNEDRIVRPPLDDPEVLYSLLSSGQDVIVVGNEPTLRSRDVFDELLADATEYTKI
jgi:CRISPR/Cas system-associated exonuclease Cas4 (RecB family)